MERHRVPAMPAARAGRADERLPGAIVTRFRVHDRPPRRHVDAAGPVLRHIVVGADQFPGGAVEYVEEPVLRGLHQNLALAPLDLEVRQHDVLGGGEVPGVRRRRLIMPYVLAAVGADRDYRREIEVVPAARRAIGLVPWAAVAGADVKQVELRVVGHRVPHRAAAAVLPEFAVPGSARLGEILGLGIVLVRRTGHREEAPELLAVVGVIGSDVATYAELGAAVADDHLAIDHPWCSGDGIGLVLVNGDL